MWTTLVQILFLANWFGELLGLWLMAMYVWLRIRNGVDNWVDDTINKIQNRRRDQ